MGPWFYLGYMSKYAFRIPCGTSSNRGVDTAFGEYREGGIPAEEARLPRGIMFELDPEGYVHLIGMNFKGIPGRGNNICKDIGCLG